MKVSSLGLLSTMTATFLLIPRIAVAQTQPIGEDQILATPTLYQITTGGSFACVDPGSRCVYRHEEFGDVDTGDGQSTRNEEGDVWSAIQPENDFLQVGACASTTPETSCFVKCNAKCTCVQPDGTDCAVGTTRPPIAPPTGAPPVSAVCPERQNTNQCRKLMAERMPPNNYFDCYNFCGGIFVSSCEYGTGRCGALSCDNFTSDGGINSLVLGCTDEDRPNNGGSSGGSSSTNGGSGSVALLGQDSMQLLSGVVVTALAWLMA